MRIQHNAINEKRVLLGRNHHNAKTVQNKLVLRPRYLPTSILTYIVLITIFYALIFSVMYNSQFRNIQLSIIYNRSSSSSQRTSINEQLYIDDVMVTFWSVNLQFLALLHHCQYLVMSPLILFRHQLSLWPEI